MSLWLNILYIIINTTLLLCVPLFVLCKMNFSLCIMFADIMFLYYFRTTFDFLLFSHSNDRHIDFKNSSMGKR